MTQITPKLINSVENCVDDNLYGLVKTHSGLRLMKENRVVVRSDIEMVKQKGQVTLLSGGGSGHEPFAAGFVGYGMLSGAVAGSIFTSPTPTNTLAAIRILGSKNSGGVLVLVCNYTGDRLTFGQAVERARLEGHKVEMIVVGEDCALTSVNKSVGRRGLCGMILIQKICGALAESGVPLEDIVSIASIAAKNMGTIGVSMTSCSPPGSGLLFTMPNDEMELGLGIHGEAGVRRIKVRTAEAVVETMVNHMTNVESVTHLKIKSGLYQYQPWTDDDTVVLVINNLGGLTQLEMNIFTSSTIDHFSKQLGVKVMRCYVGSFQSSLEMAGVTLTVMHVDDKILKWLDASTSAPAWQQVGKGLVTPESNVYLKPPTVDGTAHVDQSNAPTLQPAEVTLFSKCILQACESIIVNEAKLNMLDSGCGDGDCGMTLKTGAEAVRALIENGMDCSCPKIVFLSIASILSDSMGGSSGGLYSIFFTAASGAVSSSLAPLDWCWALECGTNAIMHYGGAEPGDRTMIDPLTSAHSMLRAQLEVGSRPLAALTVAVDEAYEACQQTATMRARAGRASYVSVDFLTQPDAGATAVTILLQAILDTLKVG